MLHFSTLAILVLVVQYSFTDNITEVIKTTPVAHISTNVTLRTTSSIETTTVKVLLSEHVNNKTTNITLNETVNSTAEIKLGEVETNPGSGVISYFQQLFKSKPAIGGNCTKEEDCEGRESHCHDGTCQCKDGFVAAIDKWHCLKVAKSVGDDCIQDAQCFKGLSLKEGDAMCTSFKCVCGTGTIYRAGTCIKSIYLGDVCQSDNDCLTTNSHCLQGICACPMDMIPGAESKQCLPAISSLETSNCVHDEQCQHFMGDNALCGEESKCICKPRTHFNTSLCVPDLKLGDSCKISIDCISSHESNSESKRQCIDELCKCATGFVEITEEDSCLNAAVNLSTRYIVIYTLILTILLIM